METEMERSEPEQSELEQGRPEDGRLEIGRPDGESPRLRAMVQDDVPELARMEREIFSDPWSEGSYLELFQYSYHISVTAEICGRAVGCACMTLLGTEGGIDKVMVDERFRGQGIGMALVQELMRIGRERGAEEFTLEVRRSNLPAIRLYERNGFVSEGVRPGFYDKPREDAVIMWNRIGAQANNYQSQKDSLVVYS